MTEQLRLWSQPELGEIRRAEEIGYKGHDRCVWAACPECGKLRWIKIYKVHSRLCLRCSRLMARNGQWKGGRHKDKSGYISVKLSPDDFFYPMTRAYGYVFEHRLVTAKHLGRCLQPWEKVHHRDGIRDHNEYNNLKLTTNGSHAIEHSKGYRDGYQKGLIDGRTKQIAELKQEIRLLRWEIKESRGVNR